MVPNYIIAAIELSSCQQTWRRLQQTGLETAFRVVHSVQELYAKSRLSMNKRGSKPLIALHVSSNTVGIRVLLSQRKIWT